VIPIWNGQFVLLWRPPLLEHKILHVGSQGNDVLWLRERLARIEGGTPAAEKVLQHAYFDEDLRQQVIRFQERNGLQTDGMVGENTLLYLNIAAGESLTPVLTAPTQEKTH
jgi:general secretion pathway protein A